MTTLILLMNFFLLVRFVCLMIPTHATSILLDACEARDNNGKEVIVDV